MNGVIITNVFICLTGFKVSFYHLLVPIILLIY